MISAAGYSENTFNLKDPGRLCRGRERWIEPYEVEESEEPIYRCVVSGARFEDDSARDALRGVQHSGISVVDVVAGILGDNKLLAFMEDGHPADMPEAAEHIEAYSGYRYGGTRTEALVRWTVSLKGSESIGDLLGPDPMADVVRGFAVPRKGADEEKLRELLFLLTGMSTLDSPPARYQPAAIPEVLEEAELIVLMHRDKHGPALGIYGREAVDLKGILTPLAEASETLLVPFAIPPMLARWDRALSELRSHWDEEVSGAFPVPPAPEGYSWEGRRRRRRRKDEKKKAEKAAAAEAEAETQEATADDIDALLLIEEDEGPAPVDDDDGVLEIGGDDSMLDEDGVLELGD